MPSKLSSAMVPGDVQQRKQFSFPLHFCSVPGKDQTVSVDNIADGHSWSNLPEAQKIVEIVLILVHQPGISTQSIGIMASFRGQVLLLRRLLREKNLGAVDVGLVEDYQGVERDVIILSLTRSSFELVPNDVSHRVGLFGQHKRSNVALTRAEQLLIIVGDPSAMSKDLVWRQFLWFCLRNGLWYGQVDTKLIESEFQWDSDYHQILRFLPQQEAAQEDSKKFIVVSSLERHLRDQ
jgi:superfamily I DNA and/or RNA helicase